MNIKDKIKEWQKSHLKNISDDGEIQDSNNELELVLFAFDSLTDSELRVNGHLTPRGVLTFIAEDKAVK